MFKLFRPPAAALRIDDIMPYAESALSRELRGGGEKMSVLQDAIKNDFLVLRGHINNLEGRNAGGYAETVKQRFCSSAKNAIDSISEGEWHEFLQSAKDALGAVSRVGMKEFRHLHAFRDDMSRIAVKIKAIETNINEFKRLSQSYKLAEMKGIGERVAELRGVANELSVVGYELKLLEGDMLSAEKEHDAIQTEISRLKASVEQKEETEEPEAAIIRQKIASELVPSRILRKFLHAAALRKEEAAFVDGYVKDPVRSFLDDKAVRIRHILEQAYKLSVFDADDKERIRNALRKLDFLISMRLHHEALQNELDEKERLRSERLEPLFRKKKSLEEKAEEITHQFAKMKEKRTSLEVRTRRLEKELSSKQEALESSLRSLTGQKVSITVNTNLHEAD